MSERLRLFVALDLPAEVRSALAAWCERAAPDGVRRVPAANLHVTLAFLGSRSQEDASLVASLLPGLARDVGTLETAGALWLPPRRPGVLTVALVGGAPGLAALQADVVSALAGAIGFEPEQRPFRPHVTVGRVPRGTRLAARELDPPAPCSPSRLRRSRSIARTPAGAARATSRLRAAPCGSVANNGPHRAVIRHTPRLAVAPRAFRAIRPHLRAHFYAVL